VIEGMGRENSHGKTGQRVGFAFGELGRGRVQEGGPLCGGGEVREDFKLGGNRHGGRRGEGLHHRKKGGRLLV